MNIQKSNILNCLVLRPFVNQRLLAETSGYSLGTVNRCLKELAQEGYVNEDMQLTYKATVEYRKKAPKNAIILAAGYGMRMVPINMEVPKALLEVNGEKLIERLIRQLHEVGIWEIYVVVGFMKEKFEYLIDAYGVELIVNPDYSRKNNLHSMKYVLDLLSNTYIVPCDLWCRKNPFSKNELYSWYMVSEQTDSISSVRVNRKMELVKTTKNSSGNAMLGICYLLEDDARIVSDHIQQLCNETKNDEAFWEEALYSNFNRKGQMLVQAKVVACGDIMEINTYEQLRELDAASSQLKSAAVTAICEIFGVLPNDIKNIKTLKKGMTNRSFLFECKNKRYIMRIPGEGTSKLINRQEEADVYRTISDLELCDNIIHINPQNGYKITEYIEDARVCDPSNVDDLIKCMQKLRDFHAMSLSVNHDFDIFKMIDFYESLWRGQQSTYQDYCITKKNVLSLKTFIDQHAEKKVLTHIDAVPDNFLFFSDATGGEDLRIIDWEYAAMQDPHVDIAMFCIYAMYDKQQVDRLIDIYFGGGCSDETRTKIYCYIAACGLLWSNWCEYKYSLGVEFGEYSLRQYRFAKDYYRIAIDRIKMRA